MLGNKFTTLILFGMILGIVIGWACNAAFPDPKTAAWWLTQPEAWSACRHNPEPPKEAMTRYVNWLKSLPGKPVFVAYPTAFDFPFVYFYLTEFVGENPFGYSAIDIKTYSMALMRKPYRMCGKRSMPAEWLDPLPHTHVALDDAIEQGRLFCNMLKANGAVALRGKSLPEP